MIIDNIVNTNTDTTIVSASPTTNYRTSDLVVSSASGGSRAVIQFILPTSINPEAIISAELHLYPKTLVGSNTSPVLETTLVSNALDYRYVTWNNYNTGSPWSTAGGDVIAETHMVLPAISHNLSERVILDCTNSLMYAYGPNKILTIHLMVLTSSANADIVYYSYETLGNGPKLVIKERQAHTSERLGRSAGMPSMPSA